MIVCHTAFIACFDHENSVNIPYPTGFQFCLLQINFFFFNFCLKVRFLAKMPAPELPTHRQRHYGRSEFKWKTHCAFGFCRGRTSKMEIRHKIDLVAIAFKLTKSFHKYMIASLKNHIHPKRRCRSTKAIKRILLNRPVWR